MFGGGTTAIVVVVSFDAVLRRGHFATKITLRRDGAEWHFRPVWRFHPGWKRPVMNRAVPRRFTAAELKMPEWRLRHGSFTAEEIRKGFKDRTLPWFFNHEKPEALRPSRTIRSVAR